MAITLTSIGSNQAKAGTSLAITVPVGGVPAGALVIVCAGLASDVTGLTDTATNSYTSIGSSTRTGIFARAYYTYATAGLVSGNTITVSSSGGFVGGISAFYVSGAIRSGSPIAYTALATNNSNATPSVGPPIAVTNGAVFAVLATNGPLGDTFTQDTTPDVFTNFPVRNGSTGASAGSNCTVAGGAIITSGTPTFAPAITSRPWASLMLTLKPFGYLVEAISSSSSVSSTINKIGKIAGAISSSTSVSGTIHKIGKIAETISSTSVMACSLGKRSPVLWDATHTDDATALSGGNLTITGYGTTTQWHITLASTTYATGKYYLETTVTQNASGTGAWSLGVASATISNLNTELGM